MKDSFKTNVIILLLVLVIALMLGNIYMNKKLLKDYIDFTNNPNITDNNSTNNGAVNTDIQDFSLEIQYANKEIELDYKVKNNNIIKSEYTNEISGEILTGDDAQKIFETKLSDIDFKGPQSQVVDLILEALNLESDFNKFSLDVEYMDNTEVDFKINEY